MSTEVGWCAFCGGGDRWIKTCRAPDGSRLRVCDPCWEAKRKAGLVIVPGDHLVSARCERCGAYGNPRGFAGLRAGGRHGAYSGTCRACAEAAREAVGEAARALRAAISSKGERPR